jgi:arabinan endo-1,5-alpha-L-arabinosidase
MPRLLQLIGCCVWLCGGVAVGQPPTDDSQPTISAGQQRRRDAEVLRIHDPSTIVSEDGRYRLFFTGRGVGSLSSDDLTTWRRGPGVFDRSPEWVADVVPGHSGRFWAPDVIRLKDRWLVYYSVSSFGKNASAIGLASSPTLDPADERFGWTDQGIVVQTDGASNHNAIDPSVLLTSAGELWMAYGSFWSGIKLVQLDPQTGLLLNPAGPVHALAFHEQIEAPGLYERDGWFYLFVNWGWCCRGVNSTYEIRVGRSRTVTGPYFDREGRDLRLKGGTLVLATEGAQIGPGHAGLLQAEEGWILSYHYYDRDADGSPRLGLRPLRWTGDGWPEIAGDPLPLEPGR